jgi:hypothetical protein
VTSKLKCIASYFVAQIAAGLAVAAFSLALVSWILKSLALRFKKF